MSENVIDTREVSVIRTVTVQQWTTGEGIHRHEEQQVQVRYWAKDGELLAEKVYYRDDWEKWLRKEGLHERRHS